MRKGADFHTNVSAPLLENDYRSQSAICQSEIL